MNVDSKQVIYTFKIVIIGAGAAGKTCLFNRYCFNSYNLNTELTIGINFHSTYLTIHCKDNEGNDEEKYVVNSIFDFGGQDRFKPLIPKFLDGADGALFVFDSVSYSSFQLLDYWYDNLRENNEGSEIPKFLIGSKSDLLDEVNEAEIVNEDYINEFIKEKNINGFFRTSALKNYNVLKVFKELTNLMLKYQKAEAIVV